MQILVTFHLNMSPTMKKMKISILFRSTTRKLFLCYLLFYLVWWPHFVISKQHFCWFLLKYLEYTKFQHNSQKNMTKLLVPKSECFLLFFFFLGGGVMLWIISGPFKVYIANTSYVGKVDGFGCGGRYFLGHYG